MQMTNMRNIGMEEIKPCVAGTVAVRETEYGLTFDRFTTAQIKAFGRAAVLPFCRVEDRTMFMDNCNMSSNVMLDFETSSPIFLLETGPLKRPYGQKYIIEIFVDGVLRHRMDGWQRHKFLLGAGTHRVLIVLSWVNRIFLKLHIQDGFTITPTPKKGTWLCLGDSITHGALATLPSKSYVSRLGLMTNYRMFNQGNAGYVHDADILDDIGVKPDIVTVAYGTNDIFTKSYDNNRWDMIKFYDRLLALYPGARVYMLSPIWRVDMDREDLKPTFEKIYALFDEISSRYSVTLIDGLKLVPHNPKLFADGLHPTTRGFGYYASNLAKFIFPDGIC